MTTTLIATGHLLAGRGISTTGKKPENRAAHRNVPRSDAGDVVLLGGRAP